METSVSNVLTRDDTFFGVCEALGEDLRIHPNLLRVGFALGLFFNPLAAIGAYLGLGVFVAVLRWFVPNPRVEASPGPAEAITAATDAEAAAPQPVEAETLSMAA